jgi:hypothetical protein
MATSSKEPASLGAPRKKVRGKRVTKKKRAAKKKVVKRRRGRPTNLTPEIADKYCESLRSVYFAPAASSLIGVNRESVNRWLARGSRLLNSPPEDPTEEEEMFMDFRSRVDVVLAENQRRHIANISFSDDWRAHHTILKALAPHIWVEPKVIEFDRKTLEPPEDEGRSLRDLSDEQLKVLKQLMQTIHMRG